VLGVEVGAGRDVCGLDEGDVVAAAGEATDPVGTEAPCCWPAWPGWVLDVSANVAAADPPSSPVTIAATTSGRCQRRRREGRSAYQEKSGWGG
jgi:hypothetical protein